MRILRFNARGVHGFLSFDFALHENLTFITGINGSGKTTVLNSILGLISPSLSLLAKMEFESISIEVENDGSKITISASRGDNQTTLATSVTKEAISFSHFVPDDEEPSFKQAEAENEYYRSIFMSVADHPVLAAIASLPTPMFLGIDRRVRYSEERKSSSYALRRRAYARNIFGGSLSMSMNDAIALAETNYRDMLIEAGRMAEGQREEMLLELLNFRAAEHFPEIASPSDADIRLLKSIRKDASSLPEILGLERDLVNNRLLPFLDKLDSTVENLPIGKDLAQILSRTDNKDRDRILNKLISWSVSKFELSKLQVMVEQIAKYTENKRILTEKFHRYLSAVNDFLRDSGKVVSFDDVGYISFSVMGSILRRDLSTLSSGEVQLVVILTHLYFNPQAQSANVFIIDEPELSLHVQWQELLVEKMYSANPSVQYILATHSPSIILDRVANCVDITPSAVSSSRA